MAALGKKLEVLNAPMPVDELLSLLMKAADTEVFDKPSVCTG